MKAFKYTYTLISLIAAIATSCTDVVLIDDAGSTKGESTDYISFNVSNNSTWDDPDVLSTKGKILTKDDISEFNVLADMTNGTNSYVFFNDLFKEGTDNYYNAQDKIYYWPGSNWTMNFYASNVALDKDDNGNINIDYTVASTMKDTKDILVATATYKNSEGTDSPNIPGDYNKAVDLTFNHICTAIKIKKGTVPYGSITKVSFENIYTQGIYNINDKSWTVKGDKSSCVYQQSGTGTSTTGSSDDLLGNGEYFLMIPQSFENNTATAPQIKVTIVVKIDNNKSVTREFTAQLSGTWEANKVVTYTLNIENEYSINSLQETSAVAAISEDDDDNTPVEINGKTYSVNNNYTADAHYVISYIQVNGPSAGWNLSVGIEDGNTTEDENTATKADSNGLSDSEPSVILSSGLNDFAKEGYWTYNSRGSETISGSGTQTVAVFIPENTGENARNIVLTIKDNDGVELCTKSIQQLAPAWNGSYGWEQIDDSEATTFGFNMSRKVDYIYPYTLSLTNTPSNIKNTINNYISPYTNSGFATLNYSSRMLRYYIRIDYSKYNNYATIESNDNGLLNTKSLNRVYELEEKLNSVMKTESGKTNEHLFRQPSTNSKYDAEVTLIGSGDLKISAFKEQNQILEYVLKKNKYKIETTTESIDGENTNVEYLVLADADFVWYIPSTAQNEGIPNNWSTSNYWSSTLINSKPCTLDGTSRESSGTAFNVIAVRNKQ